jgi:peptidoglycan/LPS O-acetylase OafA/YrhL
MFNSALPRMAGLVLGFSVLTVMPAGADALRDQIAPTGKLRVAIAISPAGGAFWSTRNEAGGYSGVPVALGIIVLLGCAMTSVMQPRLLAWGIPAVLLVGGGLVLETTGRIPQLSWLRLVGDSSYSLYLTHGLAISVLGKIMTRSWMFSIVGTLAAVGVGICFWYLMERRATAFLKRSLASPRAGRYGPQALSSGI